MRYVIALQNWTPDVRADDGQTMAEYAVILAVIAIIFVLITYITSAPLVPVAVILLGLAIIFGGRGSGSLRNS